MTVEIEKMLQSIQIVRARNYISNDTAVIKNLATQHRVSEKVVRFSLAQVMAAAIKEADTSSLLENTVFSFLPFEPPHKILDSPWFNDGFRLAGLKEETVEVLKNKCQAKFTPVEAPTSLPADIIDTINNFINHGNLGADPIYHRGFKDYCNSILRLLLLHLNNLDSSKFLSQHTDNGINLIIDKSVKLNLADNDNGHYYRTKELLLSISDRVDPKLLEDAIYHKDYSYHIHSDTSVYEIIDDATFASLTGILKKMGFLPYPDILRSTGYLTYILPGIYPVMIDIKFNKVDQNEELFYVG